MPYIPNEKRGAVWESLVPNTPGELNYLISRLCADYLRNEAAKKGQSNPRYYEYNEVMGVLSCATQELYRRLIAPYEDESINKNGDVY